MAPAASSGSAPATATSTPRPEHRPRGARDHRGRERRHDPRRRLRRGRPAQRPVLRLRRHRHRRPGHGRHRGPERRHPRRALLPGQRRRARRPARHKDARSTKAKKRTRLWGDGHGRFRTHGRNAVATVVVRVVRLSRTATTPRGTVTSVPPHVSSTSHFVPRRSSAAASACSPAARTQPPRPASAARARARAPRGTAAGRRRSAPPRGAAGSARCSGARGAPRPCGRR